MGIVTLLNKPEMELSFLVSSISLTQTKGVVMDDLNNIFYSFDDDENEVIVDVYSMEEEAIDKLKKKYPEKKVVSVYAS